MRLLDELADAIHAARGGRHPRRVTTSLALRDQFDMPITPSQWAAVARHLCCFLPTLRPAPRGLLSFPRGLTTVPVLAANIAVWRPDLEPAVCCTETAWRDAQVFAGVRECLVDAANVAKRDVVRTARLQADLGME
jgi:hypothetical protein